MDGSMPTILPSSLSFLPSLPSSSLHYLLLLFLLSTAVSSLEEQECGGTNNTCHRGGREGGGDIRQEHNIGGLPGVWWSPAEHGVSGWSSLLAAGLSSLAIGAAVVSGRSSVSTAEDRQDQFDRVYRGVEAQPHSWPWIAKIKTIFSGPGQRKRVRACGGALIAESFVVTARHCVSWDNSGEVVEGRRVMLWLGSHASQGVDGLAVPVRRVLARTDYQAPTCAEGMWCPAWAFWAHSILTNDIALLQLYRPVHTSRKIQPINMAGLTPPPGTEAWTGGWGLDGVTPSETLQITPMAIQQDSFRECAQQQSPGKLCAVGRDLGGPCPGDSGSPLIVYTHQHGPQLVGIVSNGAESCMGGLPGIFTRVPHYMDWIYLAMDRATNGRVPRFHPHSSPPRSVPRLGTPSRLYLPPRSHHKRHRHLARLRLPKFGR